MHEQLAHCTIVTWQALAAEQLGIELATSSLQLQCDDSSMPHLYNIGVVYWYHGIIT